jgi:hypothetical protein
MDTWIQRKIRAASLRRVIAWGLSLVGWALLATVNARYIDNFIRGPFDLGATELDSIRDVTTTPRVFARVTGSRVFDTGIREYTVDTTGGVAKDSSQSGAYYALLVGDRFLIVRTGHEPSSVAEGELAPWPDELADVLHSKEMEGLRHRLYPFYVSDESYRLSGYFVIGFLLVFAFFFGRKAVPAWRYFRDPSAHPLEIRVASWGDPLGVAVEVEREFRSPRYKGGYGWRVGDTYLVQSSVFKFQVLHLRELIRVYKKITKHRIHFVIPAGNTYAAMIDCEGGSAVIGGRQKKVDAIVAFVQSRHLEVLRGRA